MKLILLTGATGFVGREILSDLIKKKYRIRVVLREESRQTIDDNSNIDSIITTTDMFAESEEWWEETCKDVDTIIHAAWYVKSGKSLQSVKNIDCLIGTISMAKGAVRSGVRRFVGIGTCFEYDAKFGFLSAETPLSPETLYAASKISTFHMLTQLFSKHNVEFLWCRLFYLYGEGEDDQKLYSYIHKQLSASKEVKLTSGNQIRDYMDVIEATKEIVCFSIGKQQGPVNICSGIPITVREFSEAIAQQYNRIDLLKFNSRPDNLTDPICVVGVKTIK
jgi:nucleoside-diphosphate-sugar epimerase